jgi:hypothetical protein
MKIQGCMNQHKVNVDIVSIVAVMQLLILFTN